MSASTAALHVLIGIMRRLQKQEYRKSVRLSAMSLPFVRWRMDSMAAGSKAQTDGAQRHVRILLKRKKFGQA
jgi:hypothetical protein